MNGLKMDNEKIKGLAEPCITDGTFDVGRFTELLVNECLTVVSGVTSPHVYTTFDLAQHQGSIAQVKLAIKKHFGME
jgi:hypothetical protein